MAEYSQRIVAANRSYTAQDLRAAIDTKVIELVVESTAVVIVDHPTIRIVIAHNEVVINVVLSGDYASIASGHSGEEALSVPGVDSPVVTTFAAGLEEEVLGDLITAAEAIVDVDTCPGHVKADVVRHRGFRRLGLGQAERVGC
jgi:hypothetical protein